MSWKKNTYKVTIVTCFTDAHFLGTILSPIEIKKTRQIKYGDKFVLAAIVPANSAAELA